MVFMLALQRNIFYPIQKVCNLKKKIVSNWLYHKSHAHLSTFRLHVYFPSIRSPKNTIPNRWFPESSISRIVDFPTFRIRHFYGFNQVQVPLVWALGHTLQEWVHCRDCGIREIDIVGIASFGISAFGIMYLKDLFHIPK